MRLSVFDPGDGRGIAHDALLPQSGWYCIGTIGTSMNME
jgi:hypothetical protein